MQFCCCSVITQILQTHPNDGFAKVHLGFIIKSYENNPAVGVEYLQQGIETNEPGTQDGRFYFHLGDGLQRLGRNNEVGLFYLYQFFYLLYAYHI